MTVPHPLVGQLVVVQRGEGGERRVERGARPDQRRVQLDERSGRVLQDEGIKDSWNLSYLRRRFALLRASF